MERQIGERFKTPKGVELEVKEKYDLCNGCYFYEENHEKKIGENCSTEEVDAILGECENIIFKKVN